MGSISLWNPDQKRDIGAYPNVPENVTAIQRFVIVKVALDVGNG